MANFKEATLDSILAVVNKNQHQSKMVDLPDAKLSIKVVKRPLESVMQELENIDDDSSGSDKYNAFIQLIYKCTPVFHDTSLQERLACVEPSDVVKKVVGDSIRDIKALVEAISSFYYVDNDNLKK